MLLYGVRGGALDWFRSYSSQCEQYVSINSRTSGHPPIELCVPQGSILAPLLFLIFMNDVPDCSNFLSFTLFADDSTLTYKFKNTSPDKNFKPSKHYSQICFPLEQCK